MKKISPNLLFEAKNFLSAFFRGLFLNPGKIILASFLIYLVIFSIVFYVYFFAPISVPTDDLLVKKNMPIKESLLDKATNALNQREENSGNYLRKELTNPF